MSDAKTFLPNILPLRGLGPVGRDPVEVPVYGMDEKTVLGSMKVYVSEEMWVKDGKGEVSRMQAFWKKGRLLGVGLFGQGAPAAIAKARPDALTLHPEDRELLLKSSADQRQRYRHDRPPLPGEKRYSAAPRPRKLH